MSRTRLIKTSVENNVLTFTVGEAGTLTLDLAAPTEEMNLLAKIHGYKQKVSDAAAIPADELTGDPKKDAKIKLEAMSKVVDQILASDWVARSSDGTGPVAGIIFRAFEQWTIGKFEAAKVAPLTTEAIRNRYDAMSKKEHFALRNDPEIAAIMDTLRAEKSGSSVDTNALLGELGLVAKK